MDLQYVLNTYPPRSSIVQQKIEEVGEMFPGYPLYDKFISELRFSDPEEAMKTALFSATVNNKKRFKYKKKFLDKHS